MGPAESPESVTEFVSGVKNEEAGDGYFKNKKERKGSESYEKPLSVKLWDTVV